MDRVQIIEAVRECVTELIGTTAFSDGDLLADHGLDSLAGVELTLNLEDRFDITFGDDELSFEHFSKVETIVGLIEAKLGRTVPS
ncbi:acyl carrier protein [Streptomyces sp. NPDC047841]|uniref:acyl carrier protein n=1 Tax=Streptomyces sp. NPDC047841 TaxID=3154708 RepID=UPI00345415F6